MTDEELRAWAADWQSGQPDLEPLRRRTRRERGWLRFIIGGDLLACIGCLALAAWWLGSDQDALRQATAVALAVIGILGLAFTAWNWRGLWQENAETVRDFLRLSLARSRARRRWLLVGNWLAAIEFVYFAIVFAWRWHAGAQAESIVTGVLAFTVGIGLAVAWMARMGRRERRRRELLERMAGELDLED